ncbi:MAG TPA: tetratricopeptide repeat protein [Bacteroidetes bacterium]|nr:tetratricopeptide repeat protein [Bacteroidota bacterium]
MNHLIKTIAFSAILLLIFSCSASKHATDKNTEQVVTQNDRRQEANIFIQAVSERELGNIEKSLDMFNKAIRIDPDDPAAYYEKARILQAMDRDDEALTSAKKAVALGPDNKWYKVLFANISKAAGNYDDYVSTYEELVKAYPKNMNFLQEMAFAYYFTGDYRDAIKSYNKIEDWVGVNERLSTQKAQIYDKMAMPDSAVAEYEKLIKIHPDDPRYYALLAEYCSKHQMNDKAEWAYNKIVEINPDDPYVHISLADFYKKTGNDEKSFEELKIGFTNPKLDLKTKINLLFNYYSGDLSEKQKKQALELSEILKKTYPDNILSESFHASMLYENKDYEKAQDLLYKILKKDNSNYALWEELLFCDLYLEEYDALAKDSEDVIDLFPSYPLPYFFAGISNFQLKDYVKAKAYLESGKEFVVNNNALLEQFYSTLGDTYNELENYDASYKAYDQALKINPDNAIVLNNYAYYLSLRSVNLEKAATMAKKAVDLDPYNQNNLDTYAWVLYKQGKYKEALEWIKKAIANGGNNSGVVLEHYGDILYKTGDKEEALSYWKLAKKQKDYSKLLDKKIADGKLYE